MPSIAPQAITGATRCPCCSGNTFSSCCAVYLEGTKTPPSPEALMRSRYSAFALKHLHYLLETHTPSQQDAKDIEGLENTLRNTQWLGLKVLNSQVEFPKGQVEFAAFFRAKNEPNQRQTPPVQQLHERSNFIFDQRWFYTQGQILPPIKLGRNDLCYCASGKKLKKCCG